MGGAECAGPLIETKDGLHRRWFELQASPQNIEVGGMALLDKKLLDQIVEESKTASDYAKECGAREVQLAATNGLIKRLQAKVADSGKTRYLGRIYYEMPPSMAETILIGDINKLINSIHIIGRSFVETSGEYGGCKLETQEDTRELNRAALAYCEGVPGTATLRKSGTTVEHPLGVHSNVIEFTEEEDGYGTKVEYTESGAYNWQLRQSGITDRLREKWGFECQAKGVSANCQGKIKKPLDSTEMAYFFSSVRDIDLLTDECLADAIEWARSEAADTVESLKGEAHTRHPYPNVQEEWRSEVCAVEEREERDYERERRRAALRARLEQLEKDTAYWEDRASDRRLVLAEEPCAIGAFQQAQMVERARERLESLCKDIDDWGGDPWDCKRKETIVSEENKEAFRGLLERCPPAPIIKTIEAKETGWMLAQALTPVTQICNMLDTIDDEDLRSSCLTEVKAALDRDAAGIKPLALPL